MHHPPVPALSTIDRRALWLSLLACAVIAAGVTLSGQLRSRGESSSSAASTAFIPAAITNTTPVEVGQIRPLWLSAPMMVQEGAYYLLRKAEDERDAKTTSWVTSTYEVIYVITPTTLRVLTWDGATAHVELLDGPNAGRRGWLGKSSLVK